MTAHNVRASSLNSCHQHRNDAACSLLCLGSPPLCSRCWVPCLVLVRCLLPLRIYILCSHPAHLQHEIGWQFEAMLLHCFSKRRATLTANHVQVNSKPLPQCRSTLHCSQGTLLWSYILGTHRQQSAAAPLPVVCTGLPASRGLPSPSAVPSTVAAAGLQLCVSPTPS